ncbi:hypothetical protein [Caenispirillum bisanense]|uniref:hypothetical protein n=1 Tax=Caenispirillum bisanense TaxID=414052 RepID=UPI0031DA54C3
MSVQDPILTGLAGLLAPVGAIRPERQVRPLFAVVHDTTRPLPDRLAAAEAVAELKERLFRDTAAAGGNAVTGPLDQALALVDMLAPDDQSLLDRLGCGAAALTRDIIARHRDPAAPAPALQALLRAGQLPD